MGGGIPVRSPHHLYTSLVYVFKCILYNCVCKFFCIFVCMCLYIFVCKCVCIYLCNYGFMENYT